MNDKTQAPDLKAMSVDELFDYIQPCQKWRIYYQKGNMNNRLLHVRAIVDDDQIVVRFWHRLRWVYRLDNIWDFYYSVQGGHGQMIGYDQEESA